MEKLNVIYKIGNEIASKKQKLKKPKELVWNVFCTEHTNNGDEVFIANVFDLNWPFLGRLYRNYKDCEDDFDKFSKEVRSNLMCEYWARCEYEVFISDMFSPEESAIKVDIYQQVMMNWDNFISYLWENRKLISKFKQEHKDLMGIYKKDRV